MVWALVSGHGKGKRKTNVPEEAGLGKCNQQGRRLCIGHGRIVSYLAWVLRAGDCGRPWCARDCWPWCGQLARWALCETTVCQRQPSMARATGNWQGRRPQATGDHIMPGKGGRPWETTVCPRPPSMAKATSSGMRPLGMGGWVKPVHQRLLGMARATDKVGDHRVGDQGRPWCARDCLPWQWQLARWEITHGKPQCARDHWPWWGQPARCARR